ncbi:hypothetical protein JW752_01840 [Candidatus Peregrinibacteria bacterium]|nr:hypothetical protein [Candidatus Peregrinibacteria bacterium]
MSAPLIIFIFIHLVIFAFFVETLRRVHKRASEYGLEDTRETLPFGFVRLRYVVILYVMAYVLWIVVSISLYLVFVDKNSSFSVRNGTPAGTSRNVELNL